MEDPVAHGRHWVSWVLVLSLAAILISWLLADPVFVKRQVVREASMIGDTYGADWEERTLSLAISSSVRVYRWATRVLHRRSTSHWAATRGQTARWLLARIVLRLLNALMACALMIPLVVAALVDGWVGRARDRVAEAYSNPVRFHAAVIILTLTGLLPLVLLVVPLTLHPGVFVIYWLILAGAARMAIRHLHPRI